MDAKTAKDKRINGKYITVKQDCDNDLKKEVAVLAKWYSYDTNGKLEEILDESMQAKIIFLSVSKYVATLKIKPIKSISNLDALNLEMDTVSIDFLAELLRKHV